MTGPADGSGALIRRMHAEMWNPGRWEKAPEFVAADVVTHLPGESQPVRGRDATIGFFKEIERGLPDRKLVVEDLLAQDDVVAIRATIRGTHTSTWFGVPATGREITVRELATFRVRDGLIDEAWIMADAYGTLRQLGVIPDGPPPAPIRALVAVKAKLRRALRRN